MNSRARNEMIAVAVGMILIISGVLFLMYNTSVSSAFLESDGGWTWWKILLVLLPLAAGIVLLAVRPEHKVSKIVAVAGALLVILVIILNTTIIIDKGMTILEWFFCGILIVAGFGLTIAALFLNKKKKTD